MHPLLERQLGKVKGEGQDIDLPHFLSLIEEAYTEADKERRMTDRSVELMSLEMMELNTSLRHQAQRMETIFDAVADGIIALEKSGKIISFNRAAELIFLYKSEEIVGKCINLLLPALSDCAEDVGASFINANELKTQVRREMRGIKNGRKEFAVEVVISPLYLENQEAYTMVIADIEEKKQAEQEKEKLEAELFQAQKLESLGTLAGGIAHEINTPIQYVGDNIRFLQDSLNDLLQLLEEGDSFLTSLEEGADVKEKAAALRKFFEAADLDYLKKELPKSIEESLDGLKNVSAIVQAIKEFSHPSIKEKTPTDINRAIETTLTVTRNQWKYFADIEKIFDENLPLVPCLPGEFNQVILNLIVNAAHAIEDKFKDSNKKGSIKIRTLKKDRDLILQVSDNGCGIPSDIIDNIFDPFFTTKPVGKGTGQGLSIVRNIIVQKHQGSVNVESKHGEGTTFTIRIPMEGVPMEGILQETGELHEAKYSVR